MAVLAFILTNGTGNIHRRVRVNVCRGLWKGKRKRTTSLSSAEKILLLTGGTGVAREDGAWSSGYSVLVDERSLEVVEERERSWQGSPLDMAEGGLDPYGIKEVIFEFENGDTDTFTPRLRDEFQSYELHMMAAYIDSIAHSIRKGQKD